MGKRQSIAAKAVLDWRIRATLILFGAAFILGGLFVFFPIISSILAVLVILAYIFTVTIYCPKLYENMSFCLSKGKLTIEQGFFIKRKYTLTARRIQYVVTLSGPIQRKLGLCSLSFMTAGSAQLLQNITPEDAEKIKAALGVPEKGDLQ